MSDQAVTNSICLIALERIGQLGLLPRVFKRVLAPAAVQAELGNRIECLPAIRPVLEALKQAGFRMTDALYDAALRVAGEASQD